jgi:Fe-S-cluster-containing dehydrogenase component
MRNAIVVNLDKCIGCRACEVTCKNENGIALGEHWNKVLEVVNDKDTYPYVEQYFLPTMCQQCEDAPCVHVCPTGASYRNDNGVVLINKSVCIGCKYCMMACPYGVRAWNSTYRCVEKCTLCQQLTTIGELPMCVRICAGEARYYGDLDDPDSDASKVVAAADPASVHHLTDVGNGPSTVYIMSKKHASWIESEDIESTFEGWSQAQWKEA